MEYQETSYLKYIIFFSSLFIGVPVGIMACWQKRIFMYLCFATAIITTVFYTKTEITFMHREWYKTATWGFNITLSDLCLVILCVAMLLKPKEYPFRWRIPLTIPFCLYFLIGVISWLSTAGQEIPNPYSISNNDQIYEIGLFPLFELWKIIRFFFAIVVITNFVIDRKSLSVILYCFFGMIIYLTSNALIERYIYKMHIVTAGLYNQHLADAYVGMLGAFIFPFIFYTKSIAKKIFLSFLTMCALVCIIMTLGRSTLFGYIITLCLSSVVLTFRFLSFKNILLVLFFTITSLGLFIKAYTTISSRFNIEMIESSLHGRESLNEIGYEMAKDNFFGVGLGNYSAWYVVKYAKASDEKISIAHNIFFLNLGEIGFIGFIAFFSIYLRIFQMFTWDIWHFWKNDILLIILISSISAFIVLFVQDMFHFVSRINSLAFLMQIMVAYITRIYYDGKKMEEKYALY